jgi:hypothetical protein
MPGIAVGNAPSILNRSYTITADVDVPEAGDGVIVTEGGRWGGFGLYLLKGKPVFNYNALMLKQFRWKVRTRSRRASTRLYLTSRATAPASARAAPAC